MTGDIVQAIEAANAEAMSRLVAGDPVLIDLAPAGEVIPGLTYRKVLHAGPPVEWSRMSGAQRGAMIGAVLFEKWAQTPDEAEGMLERGEITLEPNHHNRAVGPMAGTITPSMWVFVVENRAFGNQAFCRQVEGRQQFGEFSEDALEALERWRDVWAPTIRAGIRQMGGLSLKPILAQAIYMGDELHNRPNAASSLFAAAMAAPMVQAGVSEEALVPTMYLLAGHPLFFLGLSMASAKAIVDPARGIEYSTVVTAMARNGTEFGIQVSGLGDEWFTAPAPVVEGLFLPGYRAEDAGRDIGDSAITETVGWGGFVLGGAPSILNLVGGTPEESLALSREMRQITVGTSPDYRIPALSFEGTALGIDIRKVVQTNTLPIIDTAIAHKDPGYPLIGAGLVRPPMACFEKALVRFGEKYRDTHQRVG
jgi:hypothetical protein